MKMEIFPFHLPLFPVYAAAEGMEKPEMHGTDG